MQLEMNLVSQKMKSTTQVQILDEFCISFYANALGKALIYLFFPSTFR